MKKILFSAILLFVGTMVYGQSWTAPTLSYTNEITTGKTVFIYNVECQQFLTKGGKWGTHACIGDAASALPYTISSTSQGYLLHSSGAGNQGYLFRAGTDAVYTDYNNNSNATPYWNISETSNGRFQLITPPSQTYGETGYVLGWDPSSEDISQTGALMGTNVMVRMLDASNSNYSTEWGFVEESDLIIFSARNTLYPLLQQAVTLGVDYSAASAVYNNNNSTANELTDAANNLQAAINKAALNDASESNPADITNYIINPSFDGSAAGWLVDMPQSNNKGFMNANYTNGSTYINQFVEAWIPQGSYLGAGSISQTLYGLPEGKYILSADIIACDQSGTYKPSTGVELYGESQATYATEVSSESGKPEHYSVELINIGGTLTIGLRTLNNCTANWIAMDNVTLVYYGQVSSTATKITVSPSSLTLVSNEKGQLTAAITTTNELFNRAVWTSSDENICTVDNNGLVTGLRSGTTTITATAVASTLTAAATVSIQKNHPTNLVINEIQAANIDQYIDPSYNYGGWVEFYNSGTTSIKLTGLYLSENEDSLTYFQIPDGVEEIPAGGYRVIWFDHNSADGNFSSEAYKQATFKLNYEGGTLFVSDGDGEIITSVTYPQAVPRCSYARTTDGGTIWGTTANPTLESSNAASTFCTERLADPVVDTDGKVFTDAFTFHVTIPQGTTLRYTTDGSTPTATNGDISSNGTFSVNATTIYRFVLTRNGYLPSPVVTRSFIYQNHDYYLPVVSIATNSDNLFDSTIGIYTKGTNGISGNGQGSACNWNMDWERPVNVEYMVPETNTEGERSFLTYLNQETNLEICGGWTRAYGGGWVDDHYWEMQSSFRLKADKQYEGVNEFDYPVFPNKPHNKYRALQVRNGGNDTDARIIDAALGQIVLKSGFYVDAQDCQPAHIFLNGMYLGMFNIRESNNRHFGYSNYGIDTDDMDQFDLSNAQYNQKVGTDEAWLHLVDLSAQLANDQSTETYAKVCELLDVDEFVNYMALECYLGSGDWITNTNNIKGFRSRSDNGKFHFVFFDCDAAFGSANMLSEALSTTLGANVSVLFRNLMQYEPFRRQFIDAFCIVDGSVMEPNRCSEIVNKQYNLINEALGFENRSSNTWLASNISSAYNGSRINNIKNYYSLGTGYHTNLSCNIGEGRLLINGQEVPTRKFAGYLFNYNGQGITLTTKAPAGYLFKGWKQDGLTQTSQQTSVFGEASSWKYFDQGSMDENDWTSLSFNAGNNGWKTGQAPFGFASNTSKFMSSSANTTIDYGTDSSNKRPTYYFRKNFTLANKPTDSDVFTFTYLVDDGCRIFVNGEFVDSYHCDADAAYATYSTTYEGDTPYTGTVTIPNDLLLKGDNVIAVDIHNVSANSSDIYFEGYLNLATVNEDDSYLSTSETFCLTDAESAGNYTITAVYDSITSPVKRYESGATPIRINEVSAGNDIYVNDHFKRRDWVELYNTTNGDIDISGLYLSDNRKKPQKYQIEADDNVSTVIPAHGYRVVWCDGEDAVSQLHASFKLDNADGSTVSIQAEDGTWADQLTYLAQERWQTYGCYPDGGLYTSTFTQPTIDKGNLLGTFDFTGITPEEWNGDDMAITLELASGWNWISHNMASSVNHSRFTAYAQCLKSQTEELFKDDILGWQGSIKMLDATNGYKLLMNQESEVTLRGDLFNPDTAVDIQKGWNWIGFPLFNATEITAALSNYTPSEGDRIVGLTGFATYEDGEWTGTLKSLTPGQGYLLKAGAEQSFCWNALSRASVKKRRYAAPRLEANGGWTVDIHAHPNVMNAIARLEIEGEPITEGNYSLGVFSGDECRGTAKMEDGLFYLNIHGVGSEPLTLKLLDSEGQLLDIDQTLTMQDKTLLGTRRSPYLLTIGAGQEDGIEGILDSKVVDIRFYTIDGRAISHPTTGICLQKTTYRGGKTITHKVMR